ncbi:MAG TPA: ABC transporter permease [Vicinamibacteria bacterium]|nr:ABC transporter permease [Vicinamibacteria bacterium]
MGRVVVARLSTAIPLLLLTTLLSFLLIHWSGSFLDQLRLIPGIPRSVLDHMETLYGLDRPWYLQYASWLAGLTHGDLGFSLRFLRPVRELLTEAVPRSLALAAIAFLFCSLAGAALGLLSVRKLGSAWDRALCRVALVLVSIHPVILGILGLTFAAASGWLPLGGGSSLGASTLPFWGRALDFLWHLFLPATVLILVMLPGFFLHGRGVMAELLPSPFVAAGRARGLSEGALVLRHVLPAAVSPLLSYASSALSRLLNFALLVEVVIGWPGMGRLALEALASHDPFLLLGTIAVAAVILSVGNLLFDLLLAEADPRVRLEEAST